MKFVLMTIGLLSIFHAVSSLKCYYCNHPQFDYNDLQCTHQTQIDCPQGTACAKSFSKDRVMKYCIVENTCPVLDETFTVRSEGVEVTTKCCKDNLCNGSENLFQNKVFYFTLVLTAILKLFL